MKEEKERAERERKLAKEKAKREVAEQEMRCQQLAVTCKLFKKLKSKMKELERNNRALEEVNKKITLKILRGKKLVEKLTRHELNLSRQKIG